MQQPECPSWPYVSLKLVPILLFYKLTKEFVWLILAMISLVLAVLALVFGSPMVMVALLFSGAICFIFSLLTDTNQNTHANRMEHTDEVISSYYRNSFVTSAQAGVFVEPMITYESGSHTTDYPSPFSDASGTANGLGIGARLGFHFAEIVFAGVDARYSMPQFKDSSVNYDANAVAMNWGPVIGVQMPVVGLRLWGSYIWGGSLDPAASGGYDVKFEKASGFRLGAGFQVILFSVNLEYQEANYASATLEQAGPFAGGIGDPGLRNKSWIVSLSFPMEL